MKLRFWKTLFILKKCTQQHFKPPVLYFLWHPSVCVSITHAGGFCHAPAPWQVEGYFFFFYQMENVSLYNCQEADPSMPHFGIFSQLIFPCGANSLGSYHKEILSAALRFLVHFMVVVTIPHHDSPHPTCALPSSMLGHPHGLSN